MDVTPLFLPNSNFMEKVWFKDMYQIFGWRACQDILPTWVNLVRRKIITEKGCQCCTRVLEFALHAIWECGVVQDVWVGCAIRLQKCTTDFPDIMALFEYVLDRFSAAKIEAFLVQAWFIWNKRTAIINGVFRGVQECTSSDESPKHSNIVRTELVISSFINV